MAAHVAQLDPVIPDLQIRDKNLQGAGTTVGAFRHGLTRGPIPRNTAVIIQVDD